MNPTNPNTASLTDLVKIPGIGQTLAERIIAGRPYTKLDDLLWVSGIGPVLLDRLRPYLNDPSFEAEPAFETQPKPPARKNAEVDMLMYHPPPILNRFQIAGVLLGVVGVALVVGWIMSRQGADES